MGVSRRFFYVIMDDNIFYGASKCDAVTKSLRCIDVARAQFFQPDTSPSPQSWTEMETIELPSPTLSFRAAKYRCLPVADRKVLCTGWGSRQQPFLLDADTRQVVTMPTLTKLYSSDPVTLFVPSAGDAADDDADPEGSLFFLKKWAEHEKKGLHETLGLLCDQFQAFVYRRTSTRSPSKSWRQQYLPPPPYVRDPKYRNKSTKINSYTVVGGGSHICISVDGAGAGTYCMDTVSHAWSKVGDWTLPFRGKVEYVPELKLWFGLSDSDKDQCLVAADLSSLDSGPELVGTWKELDDTPDGWYQPQPRDPRLVYLGSGRFCITRLISLLILERDDKGSIVDTSREEFAVFTGVEVMPQAHDGASGGRDGLRVIKYQSTRTPVDTFIEAAF